MAVLRATAGTGGKQADREGSSRRLEAVLLLGQVASPQHS